jgi:hypothetical protein
MKRELEIESIDETKRGCALCQRSGSLTFHHLIPKKLHKRNRFRKDYSRDTLRDGIMVCQLCHNGIHDLHDEMTLGTRLRTIESLLADDAVRRHISWVEKQK